MDPSVKLERKLKKFRQCDPLFRSYIQCITNDSKINKKCEPLENLLINTCNVPQKWFQRALD